MSITVTVWFVPDPPMLLTIPEAVVTSSPSSLSVTDSSPKSSSGTPAAKEEGSVAAGALVSTIVFRVVMTKSKPEFNSQKQHFYCLEINLFIFNL